VSRGPLRPFCDTIAGSLAADTVELADLYTLYRSCVGRLHRWCAASQVHEPMALNPRLMLHACLTSNFISTNILARSDVTTILLALPIPFRAHQDSPWPHPRDPGASRLASHESLHGATAVRAVRGARHGTISAQRPVEVGRQRIEITSAIKEK
jgi:hypothetical protein